MAENIIISDLNELERLKKSICKAGPTKFHVLSDFDRTLTNAFVNGESVPSLISILRDGNYLTPDYVQKAHALFDKYHPIEIDPNIPREEKEMAMREWWMTHFNLLIKSGLNRKDLEKVVKSAKVRPRKGALQFFDFLYGHNIPLLIMSSSGLGGDAISMYLKEKKRMYDNVYIISNSYEWDEKGNAIGIKEPIIHTMNKDEAALRNFPVFKIIKDRRNVLLLGDSLEDINMIKGFDYDNLIKIGFLNEEIEKNLEAYKRNYNIIMLNDSPMDYVNILLKEIIT